MTSQSLVNTRLTQYAVCRWLGNDRHGNTETLLTERAEPYFMAALALPDEMTPMRQKNGTQSVIETSAHSCRLEPVKAKSRMPARRAWWNGKVFSQHLRRNVIKPAHQCLVTPGLGNHPKVIALGNPHTGFGVMGYLNNEMQGQTRSKSVFTAMQPMGEQIALHVQILPRASAWQARAFDPTTTCQAVIDAQTRIGIPACQVSVRALP
ncbi:hypothetical protein [Verminephrobacter eiseniae]